MPSDVQKDVKKLFDLIKKQNEKIDKMTKTLFNMEKNYNRAKIEHLTEQIEQTEQTLASKNLEKIKGRYREVLALLMNEGFHTYEQLAVKLNISQSRARAYIAELKTLGVPLKQVRDPEGYKIGIDLKFVEQILALK